MGWDAKETLLRTQKTLQLTDPKFSIKINSPLCLQLIEETNNLSPDLSMSQYTQQPLADSLNNQIQLETIML